MKILIVTDTYYPDVNGCSYFTQRLAYYLEAQGHEVAVVAPSYSLKHINKKKNNIRIFGISSLPILAYKDFRFAHPFFLQAQMRKILKDFQPDIVHLQSHFIINRTMLKVAQKQGFPIVATNHFMPENLTHYLPLPKKTLSWVNKYMWRDFAKVFNKVPFVTTPTEIAANLIRPHLFVPVIPVTCGIDLEKFNPKNDGVYLQKRYAIPKEKPILLFVGRLDAEKNIDQVICASAQTMKEADFCLVIAGKGFEAVNLQKLAKKLKIDDKVFFTGFVPDEDLPFLYKIADCFINACPFELQCIAVMEAMATGLPVIAVNAGALPHLARENENGLLFPPGDISTLKKKIIEMISNKEKRGMMGQKSLEIIKEHSIEATIEKYLEIYKQAIKQKEFKKIK